MVDQLTGLAAGGGEAEAVDHVVQPALDQAQEVLSGVAAHALGLLVVHVELLLQNAVDELNLLLLGQLQGILGLLGAALAAGVLVGSLGIAHGRRGDTQRSAALENRLCIFCHW